MEYNDQYGTDTDYNGSDYGNYDYYNATEYDVTDYEPIGRGKGGKNKNFDEGSHHRRASEEQHQPQEVKG